MIYFSRRIFETKNKWPKAQHLFEDDGLINHRVKFHDSAINFYVRIFHLKNARSIKKRFHKYSLERLANTTHPWELSCGLSPKETNLIQSPGVNQKLAWKWLWRLFQGQSIYCCQSQKFQLHASHIAMGNLKFLTSRNQTPFQAFHFHS